MKTISFAAAALVLAAGLAATPAFATNGRQAVGMCIDQPGCTYAVSKDGTNIDIITADGTYIHCPDAKSECVIPRRVVKPSLDVFKPAAAAGAAMSF